MQFLYTKERGENMIKIVGLSILVLFMFFIGYVIGKLER